MWGSRFLIIISACEADAEYLTYLRFERQLLFFSRDVLLTLWDVSNRTLQSANRCWHLTDSGY